MEAKKKPIVFFDSGVGGLTVLYQAMKSMPHEDYIYYADLANVPYGTKSTEQIKELVFGVMDEIRTYDPKAVVIACNTATSAAVVELREKYKFPIIGMEPAVKPALSRFDARKVMVFATERTLTEKKYSSLISSLDAHDRVECRSMMGLVDYAENFDFDSQQLVDYLKSELSHVHWDLYHTLVLGCTHFVYYREVLSKLLPEHISLIDGNRGTIEHLESLITPTTDQKPAPIKVVLSGKEVDEELIQPYLNAIKNIYTD